MRLQIEFNDELLRILDNRCAGYGLDRANFIRMLVKTGRVSDTQTVQEATPKEIKNDIKGDIKTKIIRDIVESESMNKYAKVRSLMNIYMDEAREFARDYANGNDIPEENINIVDVQYQDAIIDGFRDKYNF